MTAAASCLSGCAGRKVVMCPRCKDTRVSRLKDYARYECVGCKYQFTVTSGTIFH